ncbi:MAG: hypothetical protein EBY40_05100 [Marivivens sp.]|nr:hypothetical protein [Marivivens sp.]NBT50783.1 hypothetical protein [Marivivens sp.]NCW68345.1 hypothetical protein [Marivivens sp.]NDH02491.1 hypothetical protein [Marivivens sp.]
MSKIVFIDPEENILAVVHPTGEVPIEQLAGMVVPEGVSYEIVDDETIPSDRTFRDAWVKTGSTISEDLTKAKEIGHERRRAKRAEEFAPHDEVIAKQVPGTDADAAEAARADIRAKYATMQTEIDAATTTAEIKTALDL